MTTLRSIIGEMELDEALSSREKIKVRLRESIVDEAIDWGLTVKSVEIQDIRPSPSMQQAMEQQAAAERERKAMVTRAEGEKQAAILEAEGAAGGGQARRQRPGDAGAGFRRGAAPGGRGGGTGFRRPVVSAGREVRRLA